MVKEVIIEDQKRTKREVTVFSQWKYYRVVANQRDTEGKTPAYYASVKGNAGILLELSRLGANFSIATVNGDTPLHVGAHNSDTDILGVLLILGVDINVRNAGGETALFMTAKAGDLIASNILIDGGISVFIADDEGKTAMHVAAENGKIEIVQELSRFLELINIKDSSGRSPLWYAVRNNHGEVIKFLSNLGAEFLPAINIYEAVKNSQVDDVVDWFKVSHWCSYADVVSEKNGGKTLLHVAADQENVKVLEELLKHSCFIKRINALDNVGRTPSWYAATKVHSNNIEKLISLGGIISPNVTALYAVGANNTALLKKLIDRGADVNEKNFNGDPLLLIATSRGYYDVVKVLLEGGADKESTDSSGNTALHKAAEDSCFSSIVQLLLDNGASVNPTNNHGETPYRLSRSDVCDRILKFHGSY